MFSQSGSTDFAVQFRAVPPYNVVLVPLRHVSFGARRSSMCCVPVQLDIVTTHVLISVCVPCFCAELYRARCLIAWCRLLSLQFGIWPSLKGHNLRCNSREFGVCFWGSDSMLLYLPLVSTGDRTALVRCKLSLYNKLFGELCLLAPYACSCFGVASPIQVCSRCKFGILDMNGDVYSQLATIICASGASSNYSVSADDQFYFRMRSVLRRVLIFAV